MVMVLNLSCAEEIHENKLEVIPIEPPVENIALYLICFPIQEKPSCHG